MTSRPPGGSSFLCSGAKDRSSYRSPAAQAPGSGDGDAKLPGRHPGPLDAVADLLERDLARVVRGAMVGFLVDAERGEAAIVARAEALPGDEVGGTDQRVTDLLRGLDARVLRVDHADVAHLGDAVRVLTAVLPDP